MTPHPVRRIVAAVAALSLGLSGPPPAYALRTGLEGTTQSEVARTIGAPATAPTRPAAGMEEGTGPDVGIQKLTHMLESEDLKDRLKALEQLSRGVWYRADGVWVVPNVEAGTTALIAASVYDPVPEARQRAAVALADLVREINAAQPRVFAEADARRLKRVWNLLVSSAHLSSSRAGLQASMLSLQGYRGQKISREERRTIDERAEQLRRVDHILKDTQEAIAEQDWAQARQLVQQAITASQVFKAPIRIGRLNLHVNLGDGIFEEINARLAKIQTAAAGTEETEETPLLKFLSREPNRGLLHTIVRDAVERSKYLPYGHRGYPGVVNTLLYRSVDGQREATLPLILVVRQVQETRQGILFVASEQLRTFINAIGQDPIAPTSEELRAIGMAHESIFSQGETIVMLTRWTYPLTEVKPYTYEKRAPEPEPSAAPGRGELQLQLQIQRPDVDVQAAFREPGRRARLSREGYPVTVRDGGNRPWQVERALAVEGIRHRWITSTPEGQLVFTARANQSVGALYRATRMLPNPTTALVVVVGQVPATQWRRYDSPQDLLKDLIAQDRAIQYDPTIGVLRWAPATAGMEEGDLAARVEAWLRKAEIERVAAIERIQRRLAQGPLEHGIVVSARLLEARDDMKRYVDLLQQVPALQGFVVVLPWDVGSLEGDGNPFLKSLTQILEQRMPVVLYASTQDADAQALQQWFHNYRSPTDCDFVGDEVLVSKTDQLLRALLVTLGSYASGLEELVQDIHTAVDLGQLA